MFIMPVFMQGQILIHTRINVQTQFSYLLSIELLNEYLWIRLAPKIPHHEVLSCHTSPTPVGCCNGSFIVPNGVSLSWIQKHTSHFSLPSLTDLQN